MRFWGLWLHLLPARAEVQYLNHTEALGPLRVIEITTTRYGDVNGMIHIL